MKCSEGALTACAQTGLYQKQVAFTTYHLMLLGVVKVVKTLKCETPATIEKKRAIPELVDNLGFDINKYISKKKMSHNFFHPTGVFKTMCLVLCWTQSCYKFLGT